MSTDLEVIALLEERLQIQIPRLEDQFAEARVGYRIDGNQKVVLLRLATELREFPRSILKLNNLSELALWYANLVALPPEISELQNLEYLLLHFGNLSYLPEEIGLLRKMKGLFLSNNKLKALPKTFRELTELESLHLGTNQFTAFPTELLELKNLEQLWLEGNQIVSIPPAITQLNKLRYLNLNGNPLKQPPPEIAAQGMKGIIEYLRKLPEGATERNEAKLILVGQGDVGKTCLAKRLIYNTFQKENSTEGIEILKWDIAAPTTKQEVMKLNVWDFGGQEIYHATHQFFLTKRSVYLLVWNARKSRDYEHIYYWLHTIEAFGEDSPIILVMSKCKERDDDLNMKDLRERFPQIAGLYKTDSEDGTGVLTLQEAIRQTAWKLPHMRTPWIDAWFNVRRRLEEDGRNWIDLSEFQRICRSEGLDKKQIDILDDYLHDLGIIIHFHYGTLNLANMVILRPEWATDAVYKVLDTQSVHDRDGVLLHSELEDIWNTDTYPLSVFPNLLDLMNQFELAYELPNQKTHLVAELLPSTQPDFSWDYVDNLRFYYRYDFLPAGVLTRFIVLTHQDLEVKPDGKQLCWREGAVLRIKNTYAFVKVNPIQKLIEIRIKGTETRELLAIIRREFDHINSSIKKLKVKEEIPCNCSSDCPKIWIYANLLNLELKMVKVLVCDESGKKISISQLLDGYESPEDRLTDTLVRREIHIYEGVGPYDGMHGVKTMNNKPDHPQQRSRNPWVSGSFYLFAAVVILALLAVISNTIPSYALAVVFIGGLLAIAIVGALQLRNDDTLSEENFVTLMIETFKRMPLLKGDKSTK